jgi:hypothetical protein
MAFFVFRRKEQVSGESSEAKENKTVEYLGMRVRSVVMPSRRLIGADPASYTTWEKTDIRKTWSKE